jgi:hypothetical protein
MLYQTGRCLSNRVHFICIDRKILWSSLISMNFKICVHASRFIKHISLWSREDIIFWMGLYIYKDRPVCSFQHTHLSNMRVSFICVWSICTLRTLTWRSMCQSVSYRCIRNFGCRFSLSNKMKNNKYHTVMENK